MPRDLLSMLLIAVKLDIFSLTLLFGNSEVAQKLSSRKVYVARSRTKWEQTSLFGTHARLAPPRLFQI